ncbi:hypothetical protein [Streptomyces wuyuanensis]|uniref:hypothetical protein n=1 Tax=Streptomyces wuyuanensis TaxID=1196353 RepID=UPI003719B075
MNDDESRPEPDEPDATLEGSIPPASGHLVDLPGIRQALEASMAPLRKAFADMTRINFGTPVVPMPKLPIDMPDLSYLAPKVNWAEVTGIAQLVPNIRRTLAAFLPGNWLDGGLDYGRMTDVIKAGIPLTWVPPADVIRVLVAAPDDAARATVLEANRDAIVESCRLVLAEVSRPELQYQVHLLEECVDLMASGRHMGAQALAASVWDTVYRAVWRAEPELNGGKGWSYAGVAGRLPQIDHKDTVIEFRLACVFGPFVKACESFWKPPVPTAFNRHATVHTAGPTQYTVANALTALMLAVSIVRELETGELSAKFHD